MLLLKAKLYEAKPNRRGGARPTTIMGLKRAVAVTTVARRMSVFRRFGSLLYNNKTTYSRSAH
eukprot:1509201-Pleurochrysis_carterae.AAC.4